MTKQSKKSFTARCKQSNYLTKINWVILIFTLLLVAYLMIGDRGNISHLPFGAGDYYYTDVDGFDKIFYTGKVKTGTQHPWFFGIIFVGWAYISWKFFKWVDKSN